MDNNEVYALLEDIKNGLKGINDRLENTPKASNGQSGGQTQAMDLAPIKDLFDSSAKEHQQQTKAMLTKFGEAEVNTSNRILHLLRDLKEMFVRNSEERTDEPQDGRATGAYPPPLFRHPVEQGLFSFGRHGCRVQPFYLGQHRALEIQATVCGRCLEVPGHPFMGRMQCKDHPLAERCVRYPA